MRYVWIAAIDCFCALPNDEIERRAIGIELAARRKLERLKDAQPGEAQAILADWVEQFATQQRCGHESTDEPSSTRRSRRTARDP